MSQISEDLIAICRLLDIPLVNNNNTSAVELLRSIVPKLRLLSNEAKCKQNLLTNLSDSLAFSNDYLKNLAEEQEFWNELNKFNDILKQDHSCRNEMLLNRLDCTIESFKWKGTDNKSRDSSKKDGSTVRNPLDDLIHEKYDPVRINMLSEPSVTIDHLLAARETECDKILNSVISSKTVDCKVKYQQLGRQQQGGHQDELVNLKHIIIPDVPDRGGRVGEIPAPPKESFSQQQQHRNRNFGNFRGRGGRGGRRY